jgi:hypothetical protein
MSRPRAAVACHFLVGRGLIWRLGDLRDGLAVLEDLAGQCDAGATDGDAGTMDQLSGTGEYAAAE